MAIMGVSKFERFFRAAGSLDVDKDDIERYGDFIKQEALATAFAEGLHDRGHKWEGELNGVAGQLEIEKA